MKNYPACKELSTYRVKKTAGADVIELYSSLFSITTIYIRMMLTFGLRRDKTCLRGFANNIGADQPALPRRLISAFVILLLERIIYKLTSSEISII